MGFTDNLKKAREAKGLTPDQAAQAAGVSRRQFQSWERGVGEPALGTLRKLAAAFGVTADVLLAGVGDPPPPESERPPLPQGHEAFLETIRESPSDDAPRLVFADWLEDHGEPDWAEFIRLQCLADRLPEEGTEVGELARCVPLWTKFSWDRLCPELAAHNAICQAARQRAEQLPNATWKRWFCDGYRWSLSLALCRGFPGWIAAHDSAAFWTAFNGPLRAIPFTDLAIRLASLAAADELIQSGVLRRLSDLRLVVDQEGDVAEVVKRLGASGQIGRLTTLHLSGEASDTFDLGPVVRALVEGRAWGELRDLSLRFGNPLLWPVALRADQVEALAGCPHLRRVTELAVAVAPGPAAPAALAKGFPALQWLDVNGLSADGALALAGSDLPALRNLHFSIRGPCDRRHAAPIRAGVAALLTTPRFPKLGSARLLNVRESGLHGLGALLRGPCRAPTLRYLGLLNVGLGPNDGTGLARCPAFREVMVLDMGSNQLGSDGAAGLAAGDWPRLMSLDLGSCQIGEAGAVALAGAAGMPELQELHLDCNEFGPDGCRAFTPAPFPHLRKLSIINCGGTTGTKIALRRRFGKVLDM